MTVSRDAYKVMDLFCGCGGLSRGLERTGRFRTILGLDNNPNAATTFLRNHGGTTPPEVICGDIQTVPISEIWAASKRSGITRPGELDCLVGGPPCEGFSRNKVYRGLDAENSSVGPIQYEEEKYWKSAWKGKAIRHPARDDARAYNPFLDDPRNYLFRYFLDIAEELRPKIVLIENVRQMLQHQDGKIALEIIARLKKIGYRAEARILNAADYGVPQLRYRAFFVCVRGDIDSTKDLPFPAPTHSASPGGLWSASDHELPGEYGHYVSVREAIADLPPAQPESVGNLRAGVTEYPRVPLSGFRRFVRSRSSTPANHVYRTPSESVIAKLRAMRPGMKAHHMPRELQVAKYYYNAYARLEWDRPANTITKSFIYPGSGKFGHPEDHRILSYREAARLQSFDDDFTFFAGSQEGLSHMIGAAVPPLLGFRFGLAFVEVLDRCQPGDIPQQRRALKSHGSKPRRIISSGHG